VIYYRVGGFVFDSATTVQIPFQFSLWLGTSSVQNSFVASGVTATAHPDRMIRDNLSGLVAFINSTYSTSFTESDLVQTP
jgi:hypothetical protein